MSQLRKIRRRIRSEAIGAIRQVAKERGLDTRGYTDDDMDRMMREQIQRWQEKRDADS